MPKSKEKEEKTFTRINALLEEHSSVRLPNRRSTTDLNAIKKVLERLNSGQREAFSQRGFLNDRSRGWRPL